MSSTGLVYATTIVLRHPEPGEFARVLAPAPCGTRYRDTAPSRANATGPMPTLGQRHEPVGTPRKATQPPAEPITRPRWTQPRIDALPRVWGSLERIGGHLVRHGNFPAVQLTCTGGSARCKRKTVVPAALWENSGRRPMSCKQCAYKRKSRSYTPSGFAAARAHAAAEKARKAA